MDNYIYNRNFGCRFKEIIETGFNALVLENEKIRVSIFLDKGSDIYEFLYKPTDTDFMWKSPIVINVNKNFFLTLNSSKGNFLDMYEGGWQDILPNIGNPTNYLGANFGMHGELYSLVWKYDVINDNPDKVEILLKTRMVRAPLFVTKKLTIKKDVPVLEIEETIINEADEEFMFTWGQHPVFGSPFLSEDCVIDIDLPIKARTSETNLTNNPVIPLNKEFNWPFIEGSDGNTIDISKIKKKYIIF